MRKKTHVFSEGKEVVTVYSSREDKLRVSDIGVITHTALSDTAYISSSGARDRAIINGLSNLQFVIDALTEIRDKIAADNEAELQKQAEKEMDEKLRSSRLDISSTTSGY